MTVPAFILIPLVVLAVVGLFALGTIVKVILDIDKEGM